ncbi:MAG: type III polyketide synthase [Egibacteraceae bacterium]
MQNTSEPGWRSRPPTPDHASRLAAVEVVLPPHVYRQEEILAVLIEECLPAGDARRDALGRFFANTSVRTRHLALPIERYAGLTDFTKANDAYIEAALDLGEAALRRALDDAGVQPEEVDLVVTTTVTGLAVPSLEARLAHRVGLREDVKRMPLFGLGCVAGAAGVARLHDYLRGWPGQVAVLLAVELCSLTFQRDDLSVPNLVSTSLFGDGAAAVVAVGGQRADDGRGPWVLAARGRLYPDSEQVMGWRIGSSGFRIVLSAEVPSFAERFLSKDVCGFLADHGLDIADIATWVCHPGGPKVIDAVESALDLPSHALARTRASLARVGNLSSVSVLDVLRETLSAPPPDGAFGLMMAMGPGFCSELVLLRW